MLDGAICHMDLPRISVQYFRWVQSESPGTRGDLWWSLGGSLGFVHVNTPKKSIGSSFFPEKNIAIFGWSNGNWQFYHKKKNVIFSHEKKIHHFDPSFSDPVSHLDSRHILVLSSGCWLITGWAPLWCHPKYWWCQTCLPGIRCSSRGQWTDRGNWPTDSGQFLAIDDIYGWKMMGNWWFINGFRDMFETNPFAKHPKTIDALLSGTECHDKIHPAHLRRPTRNEANSGKALCNQRNAFQQLQSFPK